MLPTPLSDASRVQGEVKVWNAREIIRFYSAPSSLLLLQTLVTRQQTSNPSRYYLHARPTNSTMESDTNTAAVTDVEMTDQVGIKAPPALYKTYSDDPRMSDVSIILSDRTVQLRRIVLRRSSEYFSNLLAESSTVRTFRLVIIARHPASRIRRTSLMKSSSSNMTRKP